jgi:peroxiredoxin
MMSAAPHGTARSVATLALMVCALLPSAAPARRPAPSTGLRALAFAKMPPDFTYDVGAGAHRLDELVGKPVVLNFWASWCEPCRAELGAFAALQDTYGEAVPLLTVSYENPGVARAFLQRYRVAFPVVEDPQHAIFDAYSVTALPVTVVLGRDGTVSHVSVGEIDWAELHGAVDAALAGSRGTGT